MKRAPFQFLFSFLLLAYFQSPLLAQDSFTSVVVLPRLKSAMTLGLSLNPHYQLNRRSDSLPKFGLGLVGGYAFFFDLHGRKRLRLMLDLDYAGFEASQSTTSIGTRATYSIRGYGPHFEFVSTGFSAMFRLTQLERQEVQYGIEVGPGLDVSFGSFFHSQPFLFGEISNSVFLTYSTLNQSVSLFGRFEVRMDWAFRDRSVIETKWE